MKPPRSLLDPAFRYTPSAHTDLRRTFARIRREIRAQAQAEAKSSAVVPIRKEKSA